jgi:glyoxylase-like metal-dependent hydrolase (beta-lactamase superfamily II)
MKKASLLVFLLFLAPAYAQQNFDNVEVKVTPVQGNIYMLTGAGGNTTVQIGPEGVLVVDTMFAPLGQKILGAIRTISDRPIRYILNTHVHRDHAGANEPLLKVSPGAKILAHENVLKVMSAKPTGRPNDPHDRFIQGQAAWPTETYTGAKKTFTFNGETIDMYHQPNAHSDGDSFVHFQGSNVISGGDIYAISRYPAYDTDGGGTIDGMIGGLNQMVTVSNANTKFVPGHGPITSRADLTTYRDMSVTIRNRVEGLVKKGMTLEQVIAAKPTAEFEARWGATSGNGATNSVIGDIYETLTQRK